MQFITSGDRIAVENFTIGDLYTITFVGGTYINTACIGKGADFVTFQRNLPELLFSLTMETAELVSSIDLYAGGTGTNNYNDLTNKPQINDVELVGNKSLSDLGVQPVISDIDTIRSGAAAGATAVQPAALSDYQPVISDLDTIRSGAAAGATAVQPAALSDYQPIIDSSHKLDADLVDDTTATHKFATAAQLSQIGINENNILSLTANGGGRNFINISAIKTLNTAGTWNGNTFTANTGIEFTVNSDNTITVNGTSSGAATTFMLTSHGAGDTDLSANAYKLSGCEGGSSTTYDLRFYRNSDGSNIVNYNGDTNVSYTSGAYNISILVRSGRTLTNQVFKPMLRLSTDPSNLYQPYAMSNAEITAWILAHS